MNTKFICDDCKEECGVVEETFDYSGTHCTYGKGGTHHTGNYVSDCCLSEFSEGLLKSIEKENYD